HRGGPFGSRGDAAGIRGAHRPIRLAACLPDRGRADDRFVLGMDGMREGWPLRKEYAQGTRSAGLAEPIVLMVAALEASGPDPVHAQVRGGRFFPIFLLLLDELLLREVPPPPRRKGPGLRGHPAAGDGRGDAAGRLAFGSAGGDPRDAPTPWRRPHDRYVG